MNQIQGEGKEDVLKYLDLTSISSLGRDWLTKNKFSKEVKCTKFK